MARIRFEAGELIVELDGLARVVAARREVRVQLAHVTDAYAAPERSKGWLHELQQMHNPGTHLPGVVKAGTFVTAEGAIFYAVHDTRRAVAIELEGERFRRLVIEPPGNETPEACAARIREAAARARQKPPAV